MLASATRTTFRTVLDVTTSVAMIAAAITLVFRSGPSGPATAEPPTPPEPVSIQGAPTRGAPDANVVMIVFSDFQCPYCSRFARDVLPEIERTYVATGKVALAFRHLPLPIHPQALQAAAVAECAARQGLFWETHDWLFAEKILDADTWKAIPESVPLDRQGLNDCLLDPAIGNDIQASIAEARGLGVRATPTFFIGTRTMDGRVKIGRAISGMRPAQEFMHELDSILDGPATSWRAWLRRVRS